MSEDQATLHVKEQSSKELAEKALDLVIKNVSLDFKMIRALRLTCKRTKVAANATIKKFTMTETQEPEAVQRSGLLNNIEELDISFNLMPSRGGIPIASHILPNALGLLNLAADVCSQSLEIMKLGLNAYPSVRLECALIIGERTWEALHELSLTRCMPGFLSGVLGGGAKPENFPALKTLEFKNPNVGDIELLYNSDVVRYLTSLSICWFQDAYNSNRAPDTVAAMRNLLENATNLRNLHLTSSTFDFFDCENLTSLKSLYLGAPKFHGAGLNTPERGSIDFSPALARPWTTVESLSLEGATLKEPDVVNMFEAEDTALKRLKIKDCRFESNFYGLSCVCLEFLEELWLGNTYGDYLLISKLAQFLNEDTFYVLPSLRKLYIDCYVGEYYEEEEGEEEENPTTLMEALSDFLSSNALLDRRDNSLAALETLSIHHADISNNIDLVYDIVNYCPKLKHLDLLLNELGRPAVALLLGFGMMGAWPELEKLGILEDDFNEEDDDNPNFMDTVHPYMPKLEVEKILRRAWPGLECY